MDAIVVYKSPPMENNKMSLNSEIKEVDSEMLSGNM